MAPPPLGQIGRALRREAGGHEEPVLALVPAGRRLVHVVPCELVEQEQRRQPRELVECRTERLNVMQHPARNDCVERAGIVELLELDPAVERTVGRLGVDRQHVVAGVRERRSDAAVAAAADLEHALTRRGQVRECEVREIQAR